MSKLMLIEDQHSVRGVVEAILRQLGHTVICASDFREAVQLASKNRKTLHGIVADVYLKHEDGPDIVDAIRELCHSQIPALYLSASPTESLVEAGILGTSDMCVQKPFTHDTLTAALDACLNGGSRGLGAGA